ncbi:fluoride efflux transporter FluC [Naumannella huperziae]
MAFWILLAVCGAFGAICRAMLDARFASDDPGVLPRGILIANLLGSLIFGAAAGISDLNGYYLLTSGFCAALTTWSTFSLDSARLLRSGRHRLALINIALNLVGGWLAALVGMGLAVIIF